MTARARIIRTSFGPACALLALAIVGLWWRSISTIDTLAWTTGYLDSAAAPSRLPSTWGDGTLSSAVGTFSISSDPGGVEFTRNVYVRRGITRPDQVVGDAFPPPGLKPRYERLDAWPDSSWLGWFQMEDIPSMSFDPAEPHREWLFQHHRTFIPYWRPSSCYSSRSHDNVLNTCANGASHELVYAAAAATTAAPRRIVVPSAAQPWHHSEAPPVPPPASSVAAAAIAAGRTTRWRRRAGRTACSTA